MDRVVETFALAGWMVGVGNIAWWATGHEISWGRTIGGVIMGVAFTALSIWRWRDGYGGKDH